ncbi:MAG: PAS domain S-box protein [bacterium]
MNDSAHLEKEVDVTEKFSRTMRIDIAPEAKASPDARDKALRQSLTKRMVVRKPSSGPVSSGISAVLGNRDFQGLFQSVYDAAMIADLEGNIVDANVRAANFFRNSIDELRSLSILQLISGASEAALIDTIRKNLVDRFILIEACYCVRKDGTFFPAEIAVNEIQFAEQNYLCFFVRDITWRKETEEKLLVISNAVANSYSGIAICDLSGVIQYVNPAVCRMWNHGAESEVLKKDVRSLWKKTDKEDNLEKFLTGETRALTRETSAVRADGSEFDVQIIAAPNLDTDGRKVGMVFSFEDISDRKRIELAMRETERQRVMLESLGAACHHLGQPATVLLANLGIMERKIGNGDLGLHQIVHSCLQAAETLSEILHKLNAIDEYRTTPYLEEKSGIAGSRILEI